ncbi:MAG TPA: hypothetical protein VNV65_06090 [Candidatus Solibacter sp.]|nr:hypothetical protein [Candidatus Solibacter sp.]
MGQLIGSIFGPQSPGSLVTDFVEFLILAAAVEAVRRGRRIYAVAVFGLGLFIYTRVADGFLDPGADNLLKALGLLLAAGVVVFDAVFETGPEA